MIRSVMSAATLFFSISALAQGSSSPFVASRQPEVERMAEIFYNTHLDTGTWTSTSLSDCTSFTHHAFVRFDGAPNGLPASFLAIYDLNHPPARSIDQPWQGGITFIRVRPYRQNRTDAGPSPDYLIVALNRALKQEQAIKNSPAPDPQNTARCFIGIDGNAVDKTGAPDDPGASAQIPPVAISGIIMPLTGGGPNSSRSQYINFDKSGSILEAGVSVSPK